MACLVNNLQHGRRIMILNYRHRVWLLTSMRRALVGSWTMYSYSFTLFTCAICIQSVPLVNSNMRYPKEDVCTLDVNSALLGFAVGVVVYLKWYEIASY